MRRWVRFLHAEHQQTAVGLLGATNGRYISLLNLLWTEEEILGKRV